jgi:AmmeMemoRadiSam system protein B/AmmeMemoRadiSam system protein A
MGWGGLYPGWVGLVLGFALLAPPAGAVERIRESALAGSWYPADPKALQETVDGLLDAAATTRTRSGEIRALMVPHAGYAYSGKIAAAAYALVRGRHYERVIVLAPSHFSAFKGLSIADVDAYTTPLGQIALDQEAVAALRKSNLVTTDPTAHVREHSIEIELPLLQRTLAPGWKLVPILVGVLAEGDYPAAADLLRPLADEHTLVVVSSDFTHYGPRFGYMPFPPDDQVAQEIQGLDDGAIEQILARDGPGLLKYQAKTGITVCGYRALTLLLYLLPPDAHVERLSYATSGALTGDWLNSVSYAAFAVTAPKALSVVAGLAPESSDPPAIGSADLKLLHRLAVLGVGRAALGQSDAEDAQIRQALAKLPPELEKPGGAFVTLWRGGALRGCVGYVLEDQLRKPLYQAVLENGINAARSDYRFRPVGPDELKDLDVEVSVLSAPRPIDSIAQFHVREEGIILKKGEHYGLFLPDVATEMGWDRDETLSALAVKAGLPRDGWRDGASFEVFTTAKYRAPFSSDWAPSGGERRSRSLRKTGSVTQPFGKEQYPQINANGRK